MMMRGSFLALSIVASAVLCVRAHNHDVLTQKISKSLIDDSTSLFRTAEAHRGLMLVRNHASSKNDQHHRALQPDENVQRKCDAAFLNCLKVDKCARCFSSLEVEGIDWASVTPDTPCHDVTNYLFNGGHCSFMKGDNSAVDTFCATFDSCVIWDGDDDGTPDGSDGMDPNRGADGNYTIDCDALTECDWPGIHTSFLGDGICHDGMRGCYNHRICDYDGGDCCEDTCSNEAKFNYVECGHDGYACRDPSSAHCDPTLSDGCPEAPDSPDHKELPVPVDCGPDEALYRLVMYDSFGDGWDDTKLTLTPQSDKNKVVFQGSLKEGAQGTEYVCLSTKPTCYHVEVGGGVWGNEVSWEIKPFGEGTRAVSDGGSPMTCDFDVGGSVCTRTCTGKPNKDINDDPDYKSYKDMYNCIQKKCVIQVGTCQADESCKPCFTQDAPEFCFANDNFNAVIDCGICSCTEDKDLSSFCEKKATPGSIVPPKPPTDKKDAPKPCSATQTLQGSSAVLMFSQCTDFDQVGMMVTDFDQNNFGALDTFEACAHSYKNENLHGGRTALGCMQILANAITEPTKEAKSDAPAEAISALASRIYHQAEDFCSCASKASEACPLCPSFQNFKTLLYETMDACQALDEIDCDAWNEFYTPCKNNLQQMFGSVDFTNEKQCDYAKDSCGGAGPFPAFRKLDCGAEIPKPAWDFYNIYAGSCVGGDAPKPGPSPAVTPAPTSASKPDSPAVQPTSGGGDAPRPYVPPPDSPSDSNSKPYAPKENKKRKHRLLKFLVFIGLIGGAVYWYRKRQDDSFSFVRYRRARNYGGDDGGMYTGLSMDPLGSSTSFEPPTLPPPPSAMESGMT